MRSRGCRLLTHRLQPLLLLTLLLGAGWLIIIYHLTAGNSFTSTPTRPDTPAQHSRAGEQQHQRGSRRTAWRSTSTGTDELDPTPPDTVNTTQREVPPSAPSTGINSRTASWQSPPTSGDSGSQVLVVSTWRSGSSFLSQVLASQPLAVQLFEPLRHVVGEHTPQEERVRVLGELFACDVAAVARRYPKFANNIFTVFDRDEQVTSVCRRWLANKDNDRDKMSLRIKCLASACALHSVRVLKTVRLRVRYASSLLRQMPALKVVVLVRDPRATLHSRAKLDWCVRKCASVDSLCTWLTETLHDVSELERQFPGRLLVIHYEQLACDVIQTTQRLFSFLGVQMHKATVQLLMRQTGQQNEVLQAFWPGRVARPYPGFMARLQQAQQQEFSTLRDSRRAATEWRRAMSWKRVADIQTRCEQTGALKEMGYRTFESESQLRNLSVPLEIEAAADVFCSDRSENN